MVSSSAFVYRKTPIWRNPCFIEAFVDFLQDPQASSQPPPPPPPPPPSEPDNGKDPPSSTSPSISAKGTLKGTLDKKQIKSSQKSFFVGPSPAVNVLTNAIELYLFCITRTLENHSSLQQDALDISASSIKAAKVALEDALSLSQFDAGKASSEDILNHIQSIVEIISKKHTGDGIIIPISHLGIMLCIRRNMNGFAVAVCNTGKYNSGLKYHPSIVDSGKNEFSSDFGQTMFKYSLFVGDIPLSPLTSSWFWLMIFNNPHPFKMSGEHLQSPEEILYEILIPYLNGKTLTETIDLNYSAPNISRESEFKNEEFDSPETKVDEETVIEVDVGNGFSPVLIHQDRSLFFCVSESICSLLMMRGMHRGYADHFRVLILWELCDIMKEDILSATSLGVSISLSEIRMLRIASQTLAAEASRNAGVHGTFSCRDLHRIQAFLKEISQSVASLLKNHQESSLPAALPDAITEIDFEPFFFFDRFRRVESIEGLAGPSDIPPIIRPIQFTLVPETVSNYFDVSNALRHCDHICTLLANQKDVIRNTYPLRVALIQHLFTRVLPIPLPRGHPQAERDLWRQPVRYETQVDVLRLLQLLTRHFSSASLSLKLTRSFDAARILTMACMATIADVVVRQKACDIPSMFSLHLDGIAPPTPKYFLRPYGFDMGPFAVQSEYMKLTTPELVAARTRVLDYFAAQSKVVPSDHVIFDFESSSHMGNMEQMIEQLCWEMAFPTIEQLGEYVSGENCELIDNYPELEYYRDVVFMFKLLMSPTNEALPEIRSWKPFDAKLSWSYKKETGFSIKGFGGKVLRCVIPELELLVKEKKKDRGILSFFRFKSLRVGPSDADPSALAGVQINNEEDVLHIKTLPDFDGTLSQRSSELLLSYLTVPYLRIPLILSFFARPEHINSLRVEKLQNVLEGVLFEPEQFLTPDYHSKVDVDLTQVEIPQLSREIFRSPCGLLFNELQHSPQGLLSSLQTLVDLCIEQDTGQYNEDSASVILFVVRLVIRVEGFIKYIIDHYEWNSDKKNNFVSSYGAKSHIRGLDIDKKTFEFLCQHRKILRKTLNREIFRLLESWIEVAIKQGELSIASVIYAHISFLFLNLPFDEFNARVVTTIISSQIFIMSRYSFSHLSVDKGQKLRRSEVNDRRAVPLGIPDIEVFNLFQRLRGPVMQWLHEHGETISIIMESVVRVVTMNVPGAGTNALFSTRNSKNLRKSRVRMASVSFFDTIIQDHLAGEKGSKIDIDVESALSFSKSMDGLMKLEGEAENDEEYSGSAVDLNSATDTSEEHFKLQFWRHMDGRHCLGRFIPDLRLRTPEEQAQAEMERDNVRGHQDVETEINVQMGSLTLKTSVLQPLDDNIVSLPDFAKVFGRRKQMQQFQVADVKTTTNRKWLRLVGKRHDILFWNPDSRTPSLFPFTRPMNSCHSSESWIFPILEPYLQHHPLLKNADLLLPQQPLSRTDIAVLASYFEEDVIDETLLPRDHKERDDEKFVPPKLKSIREVVLYKRSKLCQIFNVIEHGRRFYRCLVFSSDCSWAFDNLPLHHYLQNIAPAPEDQGFACGYDFSSLMDIPEDDERYEFCYRRRHSLVVTRNLGLTEEDTQMYIPHRYLQGLLPAVLLEHYVFWQNSDDSLSGYPKKSLSKNSGWNIDPSLVLTISFLNRDHVSGESGVIVSRGKKEEDSFDVDFERNAARSSAGRKSRLDVDKASTPPKLLNRPLSNSPTDRKVLLEDSKEVFLLNLLSSKEGSRLSLLADYLRRIEDLSYVLVWTSTPIHSGREVCSIDIIELPRLNLKFVSNKGRLMSCDQIGMFISNKYNENILKMVRGLPHAIVLENNEGEFGILVPAQLPVERKKVIRSQTVEGKLVLDRRDSIWFSKLEQRYYFYPIHMSNTFLFTPTLASSLYLLMMRFLSQEFRDVFNLADSCVSDTVLSPEELHLVSRICGLSSISKVNHPDAHACRLKLLSTASESGQDGLSFNWDFEYELYAYILKRIHVSSYCRFTLTEEAQLLGQVSADGNLEIVNRKLLIHAILEGVRVLPIALPDRPHLLREFDSVVDKSCLENLYDSFLKKVTRINYKRPEEITGIEMLNDLLGWLSNGLRIKGGKDNLGFLFFYELMSGTLDIKILPTDSSYELGRLLIRCLPPKEFMSKSINISILRVLERNYSLAASNEIPKVGEKKGVFKMTTLFAGMDNIFSRLIKNLQPWVDGVKDLISWNSEYNSDRRFWKDVMLVNVPNSAKLPRSCIAPRVLNYQCKSRNLSPIPSVNKLGLSVSEIKAFSTIPLLPVNLEKFVVSKSRAAGSDISAELPFDVSRHKAALAPWAKSTIARLQEDLKVFAEEENGSSKHSLTSFSDADIRAIVLNQDSNSISAALKVLAVLKEILTQYCTLDQRFMQASMSHVVSCANYVGLLDASKDDLSKDDTNLKSRLAFSLARYANRETFLWFELVVAILLSSNAEREIMVLNPFLTSDQVQRVIDMAMVSLLHAIRMGQIRRCLIQLDDLETLLISIQENHSRVQHFSEEALIKELMTRSELLASSLLTKRYYCKKVVGTNASIELDPRFLVFEYAQNIILRKSQVEMVGLFMKRVGRRDEASVEMIESNLTREQQNALCQQMIMGSGKTTVLAPLLALMLSDGSNLVVQVVPRSLLEFSRSILRERFSSLIRKPVYTFDFDRFKGITPQLLRKLSKSYESFGVVVSHPTAIKAFLLKYIELLHVIDSAYLDPSTGPSPSELEDIRHQVEIGEQIYSLFNKGVLLIDEVDLVLHPLKSELNFPIGKREPLDFTRKFPTLGTGLRWEVAFLILDIALIATESKMSSKISEQFEQSREAELIKSSMIQVLNEGFQRGFLQKSPHLVLLSRAFYHSMMKPIIARWITLFLSSKPHPGLTDQQILKYLLLSKQQKDTVRQQSLDGRSFGAKLDLLDDDFLKLLNLSYDWIHSLLPFILERVDRVSFGLLSPTEIKKQSLLDPHIPKSRKLCAVPFIGKDVPSPRAEFSHPDVVIGLTILAYRYEGLRRSDFVSLMREMQHDLQDDSGPYEKRLAARRFEEWVFSAGGTVRGSKRFRDQVAARRKLSDQSSKDREVLIWGDDDYGMNLKEIWRLGLIDLADKVQVDVVFSLLRKSPQMIHWYLGTMIFPQVMRHQVVKLSASGQELGGVMLFDRRLGFSGTPSELVPFELGGCRYEPGSDGKMVHFLTSPSIVGFELLSKNWTVKTILDHVAFSDPPYHALIDTGALITGLTNLEVARYLLFVGLPTMEGVVFLDAEDKKMILVRDGFRVVSLTQCGIAPERRFSFYDQIHTTGMDIHQPVVSRAAITLGKDMTFRDYAQGSFRMRRIGQGQTLQVLITPEVKQLILTHYHLAHGHLKDCILARSAIFGSESLGNDEQHHVLNEICAWLVLNGMRSERTQFDMLSQQNAVNVWRKNAMKILRKDRHLLGTPKASEELLQSLDIFRERIDHSVSNAVPKEIPFINKIDSLINQHSKFINAEDQSVISKIRELVYQTHLAKKKPISASISTESGDIDDDALPDANNQANHAFSAEQQQEKEQEQEQEQEQEKEQEEEVEQQVEEEEVFVKRKYNTKEQPLMYWNIAQLSNQSIFGSGPMLNKEKSDSVFYPLKAFSIYKDLSLFKNGGKCLSFPSYLGVSQNYFHKVWSLSAHRRLKNVAVVLEWIPDTDNLYISTPKHGDIDVAPDLSVDQSRQLKRAFDFFNLDRTGKLSPDQLHVVFRAVDVEMQNEEQFQTRLSALGIRDDDPLEFESFKSLIRTQAFHQIHQGRFFIALSLIEAESIRAIMHLRQDKEDGFIPGARSEIALWNEDIILDRTDKFEDSLEYQKDAQRQCFRFFNSDLMYSDREQSILIRSLQDSEPERREIFFKEIRSCRRRLQGDIEGTPVSTVFKMKDEIQLMEFRSMLFAIRALIRSRDMRAFDAFRAFDQNKDGVLSCSELYGALEWLGMNLQPDDIYALVRYVDQSGEGRMHFQDFVRSFHEPEPEDDSGELYEKMSERLRLRLQGILPQYPINEIKPKIIKELWEEVEKPENRTVEEISEKVLKSLKVKVYSVENWNFVWSTKGSKCRKELSVWVPRFTAVFQRRNKARIVFGHYASPGIGKPSRNRPPEGHKGLTIMLTDQRTNALFKSSNLDTAHINHLMPKPVRFKRVWSEVSGRVPFYVWRAIPPSEGFVALGMISTTSETPPPADAMRCVPRSWVKVVTDPPRKIWDDSGSGGQKGSLWIVNSLRLLYATEGHDPPQGPFYDLSNPRFYAMDTYRRKSHARLLKLGPDGLPLPGVVLSPDSNGGPGIDDFEPSASGADSFEDELFAGMDDHGSKSDENSSREPQNANMEIDLSALNWE